MPDQGIEADIAFTRAHVLPMNSGPAIENATVLIRGEHILAVYDAEDATDWRAGETIDLGGNVLMPGFSNCHTHIASNVLLRGLNEDAQLFEWLETMWTMKKSFDPEILRLASLIGLVEMALAGITSFNEHFDAYAVSPEIEALKSIPLRATLGYGFADRGLYADITEWSYDALGGFGDIVAQHHNTLDGRLQVALSPHAAYSCTEKLWHLCAAVAGEYDLSIHTHLAEGEQEHRFVAEHYDCSPTAWLGSMGLLSDNLTAAHCTMLNDQDIELLAEHNVKVAHCPISNAKLCSGTMPIKKLLAAGVSVGLATDGPASHNTLDMFQEMKFGAITHKNAHLEPELLPVDTMLQMATRDAASAMHLKNVGVIEAGQIADLIAVDIFTPHAAPTYSAPAALVYSSRADDVMHTVVNGQFVVRDRKVLGVDVPELIGELRARAFALRDRCGA